MNRRSEIKIAPQPTLRARIRETTVQAILEAAEEVFADAGLHAARMDTIAAKAGVSVGTLYNHFEDRDALLVGLLAARRAALIGKIDAAQREVVGRPLRERLRRILDVFLNHCIEHRRFVHIALQREAARQKVDTMRDIHDRLEAEMKRGVKERALRPETGELAATFFIGMLRALIMRDVVFQAGGDMAVDLERLLDAFFGGMGAGAHARRATA
jgi:AcrR family transcriptional regulator